MAPNRRQRFDISGNVDAFASETIPRALVGDEFAAAWAPMVILRAVPAEILLCGRAAILAPGDLKTAMGVTGTAIAVRFAVVPLVYPLGVEGAAIALATMSLIAVFLAVQHLRRWGLL